MNTFTKIALFTFSLVAVMSVEAGVIHRQAAPSGPVNAYSTDVTLSTDPSYPGSQVPRTNTDIQIPVTPPQGWDSAKFTVVGAFESPMEGADSMGAFVRVEPAYVNGQFILNARAAGATPGHSRFRLVYLYTVNR